MMKALFASLSLGLFVAVSAPVVAMDDATNDKKPSTLFGSPFENEPGETSTLFPSSGKPSTLFGSPFSNESGEPSTSF